MKIWKYFEEIFRKTKAFKENLRKLKKVLWKFENIFKIYYNTRYSYNWGNLSFINFQIILWNFQIILWESLKFWSTIQKRTRILKNNYKKFNKFWTSHEKFESFKENFKTVEKFNKICRNLCKMS